MSLDTHPSERDAEEVARVEMGFVGASARRLTGGLGHWVYQVQGDRGDTVVVRLGTRSQKDDFTGAVHWSSTLRPLGVPLPKLLAHGTTGALPFVVLELLPGAELGRVYDSLSSDARRRLAEAVCEIQGKVGKMPPGSGYGYARTPRDVLLTSWGAVIEASLERSRSRIEGAGEVDPVCVDRVSDCARRFADYFADVAPTPFLDDMTTKNVLVDSGKLAGIVDVDWICYGDPLFTIALTRASILNMRAEPDYTDHWCRLLDVTTAQRRAIDFYTALFCVDFLGEFGQSFTGIVQRPEPEKIRRLERLVSDHLSRT